MYKFKIIKKPYGYVVINTELNTHCHLPNIKGVKSLLWLIKTNEKICDEYLLKCKERLIPRRKINNKLKYINKSKGYRKK